MISGRDLGLTAGLYFDTHSSLLCFALRFSSWESI